MRNYECNKRTRSYTFIANISYTCELIILRLASNFFGAVFWDSRIIQLKLINIYTVFNTVNTLRYALCTISKVKLKWNRCGVI